MGCLLGAYRGIFIAAVGLALGATLSPGHEWRTYKPSLHSDVAKIQRAQVDRLLSRFCYAIEAPGKVFDYTCRTQITGSAFSDIIDAEVHPEAVVFGHFTGPGAEDAVISGNSAESHPYHWGGTLLLTRREKEWIPQWYKSGLITRSCVKAQRPDRREILVCEYEDGGMGHRVHELYAIDLLDRSRIMPLAQADSFESNGCTFQEQVLAPLHWQADRQRFSVELRTPSWDLLPGGACGAKPPKRPPTTLRLQFEVTDQGVRPLASR